MRPVFCGNFDYDTRQHDLERLFSKYGRVDRVDIKSGFAFVYFEDEADARDAIRGLDGVPFGHGRRRLSVEWARGDRGPRGREGSRSAPGLRPTKTLFVINFDPVNTRVRDLERHFEPYGKITNVRIRRNFAFIQFESQEDATNALEHTNMSKIMDRQVSVEYALRDDDERGDRGGGGYDRARSPSPARYRSRASPARYRSRASPDYGRRASPDYGRRPSPDYGRHYSPEPLRYPSRSPIRRRSRS